MTDIVYSIKSGKIKTSRIEGLDYQGGGLLSLSPGMDYHSILISPVDSGIIDSTWGRLKFSLETKEEMVLFIYTYASNDLIPVDEIKTISQFESMGAVKSVGLDDILLYGLTGRYLYVGIAILGEGEGSLSDIRIDRVGDNFMRTFPEIYREENSFFHRYMSVFSSIYNDFGEVLSNLHRILDIENANEDFLINYGRWLGIDLDCDIKDIEVLRAFVREAYELNKLKGTKEVVRRVARILFDKEVTVLEKNIMEQYEDESELESFKALFGSSVYNVCILIDKAVDEVAKSQFMYILSQFVPLRAKVQLVNLKREGELDYHSYLDMNARLFESKEGILDGELALDYAVTLLE